MTKKAIFSEKQPKVKVTSLNNVNYFIICLNEEKADARPYDGQEINPQENYEYDYNEWHDSTTNIADVRNNPEKYINYIPSSIPTESTPTLVDRIKNLEDQQAATAQAVQDMILMQEE